MNYLGLALVVVCLSYANAQTCGFSEYNEDTRDYLNELGRVIQDVYDKVKSRKFDYLREVHNNISKGFNQGCSNEWDPTYRRSDVDTKLWQFLQDFTTHKGKKIPSEIVTLAKEIEEYLWEVGKDWAFLTCVASKMRDNVLEWLFSECMNGKIKLLKNGLVDVPIARYHDNFEYEKNLRALVVLMASAYMQSTRCGSIATTQRVIRVWNEKTEEDFCYAAGETFQSDACFDLYKDRCPQVLGCMSKLVDNFDDYAKTIFGDEKVVRGEVKRCMLVSDGVWGNNKPSTIPRQGTLLAKGLRLWGKVKAAKKFLTQEDIDEAKTYLKAIVKAHFRTEACDCDNAGR